MKFIFTGDIALGDHPKTVGFGFFSRYKFGVPIDKILKIFPDDLKADIKFGNLEFVLGKSDLSDVNIIKCCKGTLDFAPFLKSAGFNMINVANNHIYQYGIDYFNQTVKAAHEYGIATCGTPDDFKGSNGFRVGNECVCFLGWSDRPRQYSSEVPPYNELSIPECYSYVKEISLQFDIVCVSLHWGEEFIQVPSNREREVARKFIDQGAKIVIGHHPHVIREIEEYNGGLIAYSLGNFISDMLWDNKTRQSACLFVETEQGKMKNWNLIPAIISEDYFPKYLNADVGRNFNIEFVSIQKKLNKLLLKYDYNHMAKKALRRHQFLTIIHFIKNLRKYQSGFAWETILNAFKDRVRYLFCWRINKVQ